MLLNKMCELRCEEEGLVSALPNTTKSGLNKNVLRGIFSVLLRLREFILRENCSRLRGGRRKWKQAEEGSEEELHHAVYILASSFIFINGNCGKLRKAFKKLFRWNPHNSQLWMFDVNFLCLPAFIARSIDGSDIQKYKILISNITFTSQTTDRALLFNI